MRQPHAKALSVLLTLVLALGLVPVPAFAQMSEEAMGEEPVAAKPSSAEVKSSVDDAPHMKDSESGLSPQTVEITTGEGVAPKDEVTVTPVDDATETVGEVPLLGDAPQAMTDEGSLSAQSHIQYSQPETHTKEQIRSFIYDHSFNLGSAASYKTNPSISSPFAPGELSDDSVQNALKTLNAMRYIAGVGHNVTNNATYQQSAQAAALVNRVNRTLSHFPERPSGMVEELYNLGYSGAGSSNIAYGYTSPANSILQYFDDLGYGNEGVAGHRRWLLSSRLGQVGIGQVENFNATYVFDGSDSSFVTDVAWPARMMPTSFIDTGAQWSFSTVTQDIGSASSITVRVERRRDGKVWNLSSPDVTVNEVTEYGSFIGYDMNGCIVWSMPDVGGYQDGDVFDVTISGDQSAKSYSVEFFNLSIFPDVDYSDWFYGVVNRAAAHGLLSGYSNGNFGPNDPITRGQVAVVLWKMAGQPTGARDFPDASPGEYYYQAVRWAGSVGVVNGYDNGNFGPNDKVTREQLATMMANYAKHATGRQLSGSAADFVGMSDAGSVSGWAVPSVGWCCKNGILTGSGGQLRPQGNASRAEAAKMVMGLHDLLGH